MWRIKNYWPFFLSAFLISIVLYPSLSLLLAESTFNDFGLMVDQLGHFSNDVRFTSVPITYYFSSYGTLIASVALAYKAFEFNSQYYYILALILRIAAAFSIYFFVTKWTRSKIAGFISSLFFGVSFPGIQNTIWVTLSSIYLEIVFIMIFFDRWWTFHINPTKKTAFYSILAFLLAVLAYPARASGLILITIIVEIFLIINNFKNIRLFPLKLELIINFIKEFRKYSLKLKHLLILLFILCILVFGLKTLGKTPDIEFKMISPKILSYSLLTGYPPIIITFWLFLSNLIISPYFVPTINNLSPSFIPLILGLISIVGVIFLLISLFRKHFFLAFSSLPAMTFPFFISDAKPFLKNWALDWILITKLGGSIFLWAILIVIFFIWNKNRKLAIIGILGILLTCSYLLMPWMIATQPSVDDQSAFDFAHRYYTLPSVGMGLLLASIFTFFIQTILNNKSKSIKVFFMNGIYLIIPVMIIGLIILHSITTYAYLAGQSKDIDAKSIDIFWNRIKLTVKENQPGKTQFIYVEHNKILDESRVQDFFPARAGIYLGQIRNRPKIKFIFSKKDLSEIDINYFYAFRFDGKNIFDIKDEIIKSLNQ